MTDFQATSDGKKIGKGIKQFGDIVSGAMVFGHRLAASVSVHAVIHGDTTLADRLVTACGEGFRKNALKAWLIKNGPFTWSKEEKRFALSDTKKAAIEAKIKADGEAKVLEELVALKDAWQAKPEADFDGFDIIELVQRAIKKGDKVAADTELLAKHGDKIKLRGIDTLKRALAEMVAERNATTH